MNSWVGLVLLDGKEEAGLVKCMDNRVLGRAGLFEVVLASHAIQILLLINLGEST